MVSIIQTWEDNIDPMQRGKPVFESGSELCISIIGALSECEGLLNGMPDYSIQKLILFYNTLEFKFSAM